jgi:hypothetical protein
VRLTTGVARRARRQVPQANRQETRDAGPNFSRFQEFSGFSFGKIDILTDQKL